MKFFVVCAVLVAVSSTVESGVNEEKIEMVDALAKRFGQDPTEIRKKMAEGIINLEQALQKLLDDGQKISMDGTDNLFKMMSNALEFGKGVVSKATDYGNKVIEEKELKVMKMIEDFQNSLPKVQAEGRSGRKKINWATTSNTLSHHIEMMGIALEEAKTNNVDVADLEKRLAEVQNIYHQFDKKAETAQLTKTNGWRKFMKRVRELDTDIRAVVPQKDEKVRSRRGAPGLDDPELMDQLKQLLGSNNALFDAAKLGAKSVGDMAHNMLNLVGETVKFGLDGSKVVGEHEKTRLQKLLEEKFGNWKTMLAENKEKLVAELLNAAKDEAKATGSNPAPAANAAPAA